MIYLRLFLEFAKIGLLSVGGGLATLPFLYQISEQTGWITGTDIADMLAISESTPGAIGINMATYTGFKTIGVAGSILATIGLVTPAILIILIIARGLKSFRDNPYVESMFHCLRPASVALIAAAGLNVAWMCFIRTEELAAARLSGGLAQGSGGLAQSSGGLAQSSGGLATLSGLLRLPSLLKWDAMILAVILFLIARKTKLHPILSICFSAVVGIVFHLGGAV